MTAIQMSEYLTGCGQLGHDCLGGGDDAGGSASAVGGLTNPI
jgi:hypothetical protein